MKKNIYACALFFAIVWGLYGRKRVFVRDVAKMRTTPGGRFRGSGVTGTWSPGVGFTDSYRGKEFGQFKEGVGGGGMGFEPYADPEGMLGGGTGY